MDDFVNQAEMKKFADLAYQETGIRIQSKKTNFLANRIHRRMREIGIKSFREYYSVIQNNPQKELSHFIESITTNETFFFRCPRHFYRLSKEILPKIQSDPFLVWSAACSSGEEVYSLVILLMERLPNIERRKLKIFASDIDLGMLKKASQGIYNSYALRFCKTRHMRRFFTPVGEDSHQIIPEVRDMVKLGQHNLKEAFPKEPVDIIFCRNVLIYFDEESKKIAFRHLLNALKPGGYIFVG